MTCKWFITMVFLSPLSRVSLDINGLIPLTTHLLRRLILQVGLPSWKLPLTPYEKTHPLESMMIVLLRQVSEPFVEMVGYFYNNPMSMVELLFKKKTVDEDNLSITSFSILLLMLQVAHVDEK